VVVTEHPWATSKIALLELFQLVDWQSSHGVNWYNSNVSWGDLSSNMTLSKKAKHATYHLGETMGGNDESGMDETVQVPS
jgi:hypothetical protein